MGSGAGYDMAELFGPEGSLAAAIPGFAVRAEQVAMAQLVAKALADRGHQLIEAGTGVGKTFAYLAPALLAGQRVVVSTGTRSLQDQLYHRDLPVIARALGRPVKVALLKGRSNYLCLHRLMLAEQQGVSRGFRRELALAVGKVREWAFVTRRGDVAELAAVGDQDPVWPLVTSTRDNCLGADCDEFQRCHVVGARRQAQAADVVVVNHHLLMADLLLKEQGFGDLLPGADAIIVDEAHQLPEVAAQALGFTISARQIQNLARDLAAELLMSVAADQAAMPFAQTLERAAADAHEALRIRGERADFAAWPAAFMEALDDLAVNLRQLVAVLEAAAESPAALTAIRERAQELADRLATLIDHQPTARGVRWAQTGRHGFSVHYSPLDISAALGAVIERQGGAWIFTSATLAVGDDFSHFARRIGLEQAPARRFGSPFDYRNQALLYLPAMSESPSSSQHTLRVLEAALPVLDASGGRAFLLFTSHRALREAATLLRERRQEQAPYPLLVQGDAPRDVLLQQFRDSGNAVLLGTGSFWEGVDVKGPALAVVVIDKLPFAVPDEPLLKARLDAIEQRGGNPFFEEQVPQAVVALKQGVGRLIRDAADFGVVMLCDRRLTARGYGRIFLDSLPPMPRTSDPDRVCAFLRDKLDACGAAQPGQRRYVS